MSLTSVLDRTGACAIPFDFDGQPGRRIVLNCYRADGYRPGGDVVLVQHGMKRNGDDYRDFWIDAADRHDLLVVAPTFPDADFPESEGYNDGRVKDDGGATTPRESWIYHVPARVAGALTEAGLIAEGQARIFGHSAGGQFLHRMVSLVGPAPFASVIAANAGWYTMPTLDAAFPAGLGGVGLDGNDLRRLLATDLWILAGQKDCEAGAENLPSRPEALAQGAGRLHRARTYVAAGHAAAEALGMSCGWRLTEVPGVDHDGNAMGRAAAGLWFEGAMPSADRLGAGSGAMNA